MQFSLWGYGTPYIWTDLYIQPKVSTGGNAKYMLGIYSMQQVTKGVLRPNQTVVNIDLVIVGLVDIGPVIQHMVGIGLASIGLVSVSIVNKRLVGTCLYIYFNNVESIGLFKFINRVIVYHILLNFSL